MTKLFLRLFVKSIVQDKYIFILNLLGLIIGIAVSIIMYLWVIEELSYDKFHTDSENIYRIVCLKKAGSGLKKRPFTPAPLPYSLKKDFPQIEEAVAVYTGMQKKDFHVDGKMMKLRIDYTTEEFFRLFSFPVINNIGPELFPDGRYVVISGDCAMKVFGTKECVGKELNLYFYGDTKYIISAVLEVPRNSHIDFEVLIPWSTNSHLNGLLNDWNRIKTVNYIKLKKGSRVNAKQFKKMQNYLFDKTEEASLLIFQPLEDIHLYTDFSDSYARNNTDIRYIRVFIIAMILVYLLSNLNYIILSTARSEKRRKEIGLKKIYGLDKRSLIIQMVLETLIITIFALIVSLLLIKLFLPQINTFFNKDVSFILDLKIGLYILASLFITGFISFSYLGAYMSSFRAIDLLSGIRIKYLKQNVNRIITPLQMIISFFFIMSFLCILLQLSYMKNKNKGLDISNIIGIRSTGFIYDYEAIKNELLKNPDIISVTASGLPPVSYNFGKFDIRKEVNGDALNFIIMAVDPDYLKTFDIKMSEGEFFPESLNMNSYFNREYLEYNPVVLNQTAMEILGDIEIGDHIYMGSLMSKMKVIGVTEDYHFMSLDKKIDPLLLYFNPENFLEFYVRLNPGNTAKTIKYIEEATTEYRKGKYIFDYYFMEDLLNNEYSSELNMARMSTFITIISFCITLFGLGAMTYYSLIRKRKTISIRKVFGAGSFDITFIFLKEIGVLLIISFIISFLLTQLMMESWLNNYSYRIAMPYAYFVLTFFIICALVALLVILIVRNESNKNPVNNLRYE